MNEDREEKRSEGEALRFFSAVLKSHAQNSVASQVTHSKGWFFFGYRFSKSGTGLGVSDGSKWIAHLFYWTWRRCSGRWADLGVPMRFKVYTVGEPVRA